MSKNKMTAPITDLLRKTIVDSEIPLLRLANETSVARASLIRFVRGETSLRLDVADQLAAYFHLALTKRKTK